MPDDIADGTFCDKICLFFLLVDMLPRSERGCFPHNTVAHQITPINGFNLKPNFSQFLFVYLAFLIVKTPDNLVDLLFILKVRVIHSFLW